MREAVLTTVETAKEILGGVISPNIESQIILKTLEKLQNKKLEPVPVELESKPIKQQQLEHQVKESKKKKDIKIENSL